MQWKVLRNKAIFLCRWIDWPFPLSLFLPSELSRLQYWSHMYDGLCQSKVAFNSSRARRFLWITLWHPQTAECEQNTCATYCKTVKSCPGIGWIRAATVYLNKNHESDKAHSSKVILPSPLARFRAYLLLYAKHWLQDRCSPGLSSRSSFLLVSGEACPAIKP